VLNFEKTVEWSDRGTKLFIYSETKKQLKRERQKNGID